MKLPDLRNFDLTGKRVLVRVDFDVPLKKVQSAKCKVQSWEVVDETRIRDSLQTINHLLSKNAKIVILAHLGRPEGKVIPELSLEPVVKVLTSLLHRNEVKPAEDGWQIGEEIFLRENLRFDPGEEVNDPKFAKKLATLGDFYVNDAFAASHREHTSIVGLPKLLPHAAGLDLLEEVNVLSGILEKPKRPVVVILGGVKEDKLEVVPRLSAWADCVLIGGKLPSTVQQSVKIIIADLNPEGKDITLETIERFREIIAKAGTIIWVGPLGRYEGKEGE